MAGKTRTVLELRVGSLTESDVRVTRVRGREALSEPFLFEVDFAPHDFDPLDLADIVGKEAQLHLKQDVFERFVHGFAASIQFTGLQKKRPHYQIRLKPRLALLGQTEDSRIFQDLSVPEIVKKVLDEWKVVHAFGGKRQGAPAGLSGSYPKREYCVQYRETDLAFVSRLLEEEGIGWLFDHVDGKHTLVLIDEPGAFQPIEGDEKLPYREPDSTEDETEYAYETSHDQRMRTGKSTLRDFDFTRPGLVVQGTAQEKSETELELYGFQLAYADDGPLKRLAKVRLEEARVETDTTGGRSNSLRLVPGTTFELTDAPVDALGGKLQLLWVEHDGTWDEGSAAASYDAAFGAQRTESLWRPGRRSPRPVIAGTQTALVVGPSGEEIHTDKHGRIKVQFQWDRLGKKDDKTSCFVRVGQPWAGPGWGTLRLPRIGQEVLLRFLDGDPDRPLVTGAVYDGSNAPPITLPDDKTQSTLRSDSSPGGGGSNEVRFEDAKGSEQLYVHAQKDETIVVENDKLQEIYLDETLAVDKDRTRSVGGNRTTSVGMEDTSTVSGNQMLTVVGARSTQTGMSHLETISGAQSVTIAKATTAEIGQQSEVTVGAAAALTIGGAYSVTAGGVLNIAVGGARLEQVGGIRATSVGAAAEVTVAKDAEAKVGGADATTVAGIVELTISGDVEENVSGKANITVVDPIALVAKSFQFEAQQKLTITVAGTVMLEMSSSGQVTLSGKAITFDGSQITTKGSSVAKTAGAGGGGGSDTAAKDEKEKLGKAEAAWSASKAEPNTDVTLDVKLTDVPDGKKGLITIHHAASGALVPGGKIECEAKGGKLVDKKTGKPPVFQFGAKQLPWDPWDKPFFFFKASVQYQSIQAATPADTKDGGKSLKVKYFHMCLGDKWADAGGLTTGAEASEISGILGGVTDSKATVKMMSVAAPKFSDWAPQMKGTYCYHHGSHGTCQDRVTGTFIDVDPPPDGVGDPPECAVGSWRSVTILCNQAPYKYLSLGDTELLDKTKFPEVPRYLAYLDCCLAGWEPSLGRAFVSRGTQYVIAFRRTIPDGDAREMARKFHKKWAQTHKLDPGKIRDLFFEVGTPFYKTMRPVLVSWRYEAVQSPDAGVVDRALASIGAVAEGVQNNIGSLFK
jgi:type VI secretion system secreted protein VgrG